MLGGEGQQVALDGNVERRVHGGHIAVAQQTQGVADDTRVAAAVSAVHERGPVDFVAARLTRAGAEARDRDNVLFSS